MQISGRAWIMGDGVDTDLLAPGAYMSGSIDTLASHCLEALRPDFAGAVRPGDIILAGASFGIGPVGRSCRWKRGSRSVK